MKARLLLAAVMLFAPLGVLAGNPVAALPDNVELTALYQQDQADRKNGNVDWSKVTPRDQARRARTLAMFRAGGLRTAVDYHHAAMVFQHGETVDDIQLAYSLATLAATLDSKTKHNRWLAAAAWDRIMETRFQPQWYGTQFWGDKEGFGLWPVNEQVVDDETRKAITGMTLEEARAFAKDQAKAMQVPYRATMDLDAMRAKAESKKTVPDATGASTSGK